MISKGKLKKLEESHVQVSLLGSRTSHEDIRD
jgi:hypothetical protein